MALERFERRLERLVEGAFAKTNRRGLQPVEIGRRLVREMDLQRAVGVHGFIAPNVFSVVLSPPDAERFAPLVETLSRELVQVAYEHVEDEDYTLPGPVEVEFLQDTTLAAGVFLVETKIVEGELPPPPAHLLLPDGRQLAVEDDPIVIGRLPTCTLVLADPNVSRRHAEVHRSDGQVIVTDLGSTNGTLVNGLRVSSQQLRDGDVITLGRTTIAFGDG
jgi:hypothetical protein